MHHTIHQPVSDAPELFKEALNQGTAALVEHGASKWLSDDRLNGPLSQDILDWAMENWYQRAIDAGWKYWANVVPQSITSAGTLTPVINQLHTMGLQMRLFTNTDTAFEWLSQQPD